MDQISVKDSVNFVGCNVIIFLHGCGHTKNVIGRTITFKICQIDLQWMFVGRFGAVGLICCVIMLYSKIYWIVGCVPVFVPFDPVPSATVLLVFSRFTRFRSNVFPWTATIVNAFVTTIAVSVSFLKGWLFSEQDLEFLNLCSESKDLDILFLFCVPLSVLD